MERVPDIIHESWLPYLQPLFDNPMMTEIRDEILPEDKYYPEASAIFNVFKMPIDRIKVVILGQDPYPNGEATGYSFATKRDINMPVSLRIIRDEVMNSNVERDTYINIGTDRWKELSHWKMQGVFLLNAALTVRAKDPGSHLGIWLWFIREVIKAISKQTPCVWMLWGAKAKSYKDFIHKGIVYKKDSTVGLEFNNVILEGNHPAAETYKDSAYKFTGCNHFVICNEILKIKKQKIINW